MAKNTITPEREHELIYEIMGLHMKLEPENLSCDGELPRAEQNRRAKDIKAKLKVLFAELGREVDSEDSFDYIERLGKPDSVQNGTHKPPMWLPQGILFGKNGQIN